MFHTLENIVEFLNHGFMAIGNSNIRNIGSSHIIAASAISSVIWSEPVLLDLIKVNCKQTAGKSKLNYLILLTSLENPLIKTEFLANSHMSHEDIFQTYDEIVNKQLMVLNEKSKQT